MRRQMWLTWVEKKMTGDYQKTRSVIMSCDNWEQLKVGIKMYNQLNRLHELPEKYPIYIN